MMGSLPTSDRNLLIAATRKIRLLNTIHAQRGWYSDVREARRALNRLTARGMLEYVWVIARPEIPIQQPLLCWSPGDPQPDFGSLAYQVQRRWTTPPRRALVYVATSKVARYFGGSGGWPKRPLQATHDLHVTSVFLHMVRHRPDDAEAWISEDIIAPFRRKQKLPDAMLQYSDGRPPVVIEFAGSYRKERLQSVHWDCLSRNLPYELW